MTTRYIGKPPPPWDEVWRKGFGKVLPVEALEALAVALRTDDRRLVQGSTTTPPPLLCVQDWVCEAGCALGYCGAVMNGGFGVATVGQCEEFFARMCMLADDALGGPAESRSFLNWWDDWSRGEVFSRLLEEVEVSLKGRGNENAA